MTYFFHVTLSIFLDVIFGDPHWYPHPVKIIGRLCIACERYTRLYIQSAYWAGVTTVFIVITTTAVVSYLIVIIAYSFGSFFGDIVAIVLLYTTIAARDLIRHSTLVFEHLIHIDSLDEARQALGSIVGRDTQTLSREEVSRACIETVAENMVDGITSPLFFAMCASLAAPFFNISPIGCSVVGAFIYKSVNTMDSMIGYKNSTYIHFGRSGAKLDDAMNFIPARMSGICLIIAAFFLKLDYRGAMRIFLRDRLRHSSPNAGHSEAAVAGSLGIQLGGSSSYFGTVVEKPFMGDNEREIDPDDIKTTHHLVIVGSLLFFFIITSMRYSLLSFWQIS